MTKGIGDKVLGWFIVQEDAPVTAPEDPPTPAPAPARARTSASASARARSPAPVVAPGRAHDADAFAKVYRAAGVKDDDREKLARIVTLLESLPQEATAEVKRAIVSASLEAFGVRIDGIVTTGEGALAALQHYVDSGRQRTEEVLAEAEANIAKLTKEIAEVRRLMDLQVAAQEELFRATNAERARVRAALDFLAPAESAADRPRLVRLK